MARPLNDDLDAPYLVILDNIEEEIEKLTPQSTDIQLYHNAFNTNYPFYKKIIDSGRFSQLPGIFTDLYTKCRSHFKNLSLFINKDSFTPAEAIYRKRFKLESKQFYTNLEKYPDGTKDKQERLKKKYFKTFVYSSVLLCEKYNYKLLVNNNDFIVQELESSQAFSKAVSFYLFYNRSHPKLKNRIGVGTLKINIDNTVNAEFYYSSTGPSPDKEKQYGVVRSNGRIKVKDKSISVISLSDIPDSALRSNFGILSDSYFVVKHFRDASEKVILGINCSWNRDRYYPFSTALVLVEMEYYDHLYDKTHPGNFDNIKSKREDSFIPAEIFYYLFSQKISLEEGLDQNKDYSKDTLNSFSEISQIPYYKNRGEILKEINGTYNGLSIVYDGVKHTLIISQLQVFSTGEVLFNINTNVPSDPSSIEKKPTGYVYKINLNEASGVGEVYITLRDNNLSYYLEFTYPKDQKQDFFMKGGVAGLSVITGKPTASSVVFKRVRAKEDSSPQQIVLKESLEPDERKRLIELSKKHSVLFNFYSSEECNLYSNYSGIKLLDSILKKPREYHVEESEYEVFISIPLVYNNLEKEYIRNSNLALELKRELIKTFNVHPNKIFCACFDEHNNGAFPFKKYQNEISIKNEVFNAIRTKLEKSKRVFFIYPKQQEESKKTRISSAVLEIGYALGLKKNIIVLYDPSENDYLPANLMRLYEKKCFQFFSKDFKTLFAEKGKEIKIEANF